jgi:hypothetical protein
MTNPPVHGIRLCANAEPVGKACAAPRRRSRPAAAPGPSVRNAGPGYYTLQGTRLDERVDIVDPTRVD